MNSQMIDIKKRKIILVGGHELGYLCFNYLVANHFSIVLCIGRKDDTGKDHIFPSMLKLAKKNKIRSIQAHDINSPEIMKLARSVKADIVLSIHNNQIFRKPWLDLFSQKLGIVNAHHGPLPRYGGFWPEMWAIWNQEKDFGVTMHYIDSSVDTGNIVAQYPVKILNDDNRKSLYDKCTKVCFDMFQDHLPIFLAKKIKGKKQDASKRTYYKRELPNNGFVDLNWEADKIKRFFRAVSFYPFVGPKIKIGSQIISSVFADLPFFKPLQIKPIQYP